MLNAYSRVDKGRLFALDRSGDRGVFGPHISDAFELNKNLKKSQKDADGLDRGADTLKFENGTTSASMNSKDSDDNTDSCVTVSDTLLSNLLINSVLSALKTGNLIRDNHYRHQLHLKTWTYYFLSSFNSFFYFYYCFYFFYFRLFKFTIIMISSL